MLGLHCLMYLKTETDVVLEFFLVMVRDGFLKKESERVLEIVGGDRVDVS